MLLSLPPHFIYIIQWRGWSLSGVESKQCIISKNFLHCCRFRVVNTPDIHTGALTEHNVSPRFLAIPLVQCSHLILSKSLSIFCTESLKGGFY